MHLADESQRMTSLLYPYRLRKRRELCVDLYSDVIAASTEERWRSGTRMILSEIARRTRPLGDDAIVKDDGFVHVRIGQHRKPRPMTESRTKPPIRDGSAGNNRIHGLPPRRDSSKINFSGAILLLGARQQGSVEMLYIRDIVLVDRKARRSSFTLPPMERPLSGNSRNTCTKLSIDTT
jgi:hypothetical protein